MIEIKKRNENWECYVDGTLYEYHSDLYVLLTRMAREHGIIIELLAKEDTNGE